VSKRAQLLVIGSSHKLALITADAADAADADTAAAAVTATQCHVHPHSAVQSRAVKTSSFRFSFRY